MEACRESAWRRYRGAVAMALASYATSFMQLGTKMLDARGMSISQMILVRCTSLMVVLFGLARALRVEHGLLGPPGVRWILVLRAIIGGGALVTCMLAVTLMPLGDAVTLTLVYPGIMLLLAPLLIGEAFVLMDLATLCVSITGVTLITKPTFIFGHTAETNLLGTGVALLAATFLALGGLLVRKIGGQAHAIHIVAYYTAVPILPALAWCVVTRDAFMVSMPLLTGVWLFAMITGALLAQLLMSYSLQSDRVSKVGPFIFLQIVFAYLNDWLFFDYVPTLYTLGGAGLIAAALICSLVFRQ